MGLGSSAMSPSPARLALAEVTAGAFLQRDEGQPLQPRGIKCVRSGSGKRARESSGRFRISFNIDSVESEMVICTPAALGSGKVLPVASPNDA